MLNMENINLQEITLKHDLPFFLRKNIYLFAKKQVK